jgi:hypothetical protein
MGRECRIHGEEWNAYRILVEKPEGKRRLGRSRCRWEDNIVICRGDYRRGFELYDWIY